MKLFKPIATTNFNNNNFNYTFTQNECFFDCMQIIIIITLYNLTALIRYKIKTLFILSNKYLLRCSKQ